MSVHLAANDHGPSPPLAPHIAASVEAVLETKPVNILEALEIADFLIEVLSPRSVRSETEKRVAKRLLELVSFSEIS